MRQLIKRWPLRSTEAGGRGRAGGRERKRSEKYVRIRRSGGTALFGGTVALHVRCVGPPFHPALSSRGVVMPSSSSPPPLPTTPRTLYARPFTSYGSSRGTEPRQGETVPVDMFIISTSKPLLRFSGLDVGPPSPSHSPVRWSARRYKPIRSEGRKGPDEQVARNTSNGPNLFTFSRDKDKVFSSRDNCVTL